MKFRTLFVYLVALCFLYTEFSFGQSNELMGFSTEQSQKQLQLEAEFDKLVTPSNLDSWMKYLSARPHHVGSPYDKEVVDFVSAKIEEWGYDARVERFDVLFPTPKDYAFSKLHVKQMLIIYRQRRSQKLVCQIPGF